MKSNFVKSIYGLMLMAATMLVSCDPENGLRQGTDQEEESALESTSIGEEASDDALEVAFETETELSNAAGRVSKNSCATVTHDKENKKIIIDFGDGCVGPHGRERSGKIIIVYSHELGDSLANRIITFENYFVNNKGVTGTIELRDLSINDGGNLQSVKRLIDLKVTFPNGDYIIFNGDRTREWLAGSGDGDPANNIFRITGSITGETNFGRSFTHVITTPIISDWSCAAEGNFARISGVVEMTKLGGYAKRKRIVDYGDGTCDNIITITTIRRTYNVTVE